MARARNIKPKFFQNDALGELSPLARLLFIGLWTIADYRGCLEYRPKRIKAQLLPYDDCNIEQLVNSLDKSGFISIYTVQAQPYIKILKFERHQTPHKNERESGSEIPDIDKKDKEIKELKEDGNNPDKNGSNPASNCFLNPSNFNLNPEPTNPNPGKTIVEHSPDRAGKGEVIAEIFAYWQRTMNSPGSKLDDKRRKAIEGALKNYQPREICLAILGCSRTPHNMGDNDRNTKFNGLQLILRDADQIDRFINAASNKPTASKGQLTIEEQNKRAIAEFLGADSGGDDPTIIDVEMTDASE